MILKTKMLLYREPARINDLQNKDAVSKMKPARINDLQNKDAVSKMKIRFFLQKNVLFVLLCIFL